MQKGQTMKTPLFLLLASSLTLGLVAPTFAQDNTQPTNNTKPLDEGHLRAKHEADKDLGYDELLVENGGDVNPDHWASQAISELINKYCGIMVGYPDNTFRGSREMTRYEMAAA